MAIFVPGLKSSMSRCTCGSSLIGPPLQQLVIQLVSVYVGSHSDRVRLHAGGHDARMRRTAGRT